MSASYGLLTLGNKTYLEKFYIYTTIFNANINAVAAGTAITQPKVVLQGDGGFLLKYLEVQYSQNAGAPNYFRCRLGNSDGQQWYSSAGIVAGGGGNDRVHSALMFGNGQFPFPVIPYILFLPSGAINLDVQDLSGVSNQVEMAFVGSKLYDINNGGSN